MTRNFQKESEMKKEKRGKKRGPKGERRAFFAGGSGSGTEAWALGRPGTPPGQSQHPHSAYCFDFLRPSSDLFPYFFVTSLRAVCSGGEMTNT